MSKSALLQINTAGAWRTIVPLDLDKHQKAAKAMHLAQQLAELFSAKLRVVTADGTQTAILHWDNKASGWVDVPKRK